MRQFIETLKIYYIFLDKLSLIELLDGMEQLFNFVLKCSVQLTIVILTVPVAPVVHPDMAKMSSKL